MGVRRGRKGAFRLHHSTTFCFRRSHAGETLLFVLAILDSANSANGGSEGTKRSVSSAPQHQFFFLRSHAGETQLFLLEIMDSVNFGFRLLKYFFRSIFFISLDCHSFLGGGGSCRRQGKSAAPSARRGEVLSGRCSGGPAGVAVVGV